MPHANPPPNDLVVRAKNGDMVAFSQLVEHYQRPIFGFIFRFVHHSDDAAETTQDVFLRVYKSLNRYDPEKGSFDTWVFTIARRTTYDRLRKKQRNKEYYDIDNPNAFLPLPDSEKDGHSQRHLEHVDIEHALSHLRPIYKEAILLYYWQEYRYKDIAAIMGVSINTIKTYIRRAKEALKEELVLD